MSAQLLRMHHGHNGLPPRCACVQWPLDYGVFVCINLKVNMFTQASVWETVA